MQTRKSKSPAPKPAQRKAQRKPRKSGALAQIARALATLTPAELRDVAGMVDALLADLGAETPAPNDARPDGDRGAHSGGATTAKPTAHGHIEEKRINGCGPYLYLRYWSGKTLRSQYIGKKGAKKARK